MTEKQGLGAGPDENPTAGDIFRILRPDPSKQALHDSLLSAQSFALKMARSVKLPVQEWKKILKQWRLTGSAHQP